MYGKGAGLGRQWSQLQVWRHRAHLASQQSGKGLLAQLLEIANLRLGKGKIGVSEYYNYCLYDDQRFSRDSKSRFVGRRRMRDLYRRLNQGNWHGVSDDKLLFYSLIDSLDLPYPRLYAVYHPHGRPFGGVQCFRDPQALVSFLRTGIRYPFFLKPARGKHGAGAVAVVAFNECPARLVLADGEQIDLEEYLRDSTARLRVDRFGILLQELLTPPAQLVAICGERLSSIRLVVLLCRDGPRPLHAVWKIPTGRNMTDNYYHGASGNFLGYVNLGSGVVERVVGSSAAQDSNLAHPDTGVPLLGVKLPDWSRLVGVGVEGARALPGLRWQSWDIALASGGPTILEMNAYADVDLVQYAYGSGLDDAALRASLEQMTT
jgi:hypothetical protein